MTECTIGDICTWFKGFQVPRDDTSVDKEVPYLHYGDLYKKYDFRLNLQEKYDEIIKIDSNSKIKDAQYLHDGDIVFALTSETVDDLGHCTLIINPGELPFVSGMETTVIHVRRRDFVLPTYLNYYFHDRMFQNRLRQYVTGMKVYRVHPDDIMSMTIDLPSVKDQERIVGMLDSLSNKISCLMKINDNLSGMIESEYNKIRDIYPAEIELSELCEIVKDRDSSNDLTLENYFSTENMLPNKAGVVPAAAMPSDGKVTRCNDGDVLVSNIRPYFKKIHYCDCVSGCSADVLCFRSIRKELSPYLYSILRSDEFFDYLVAGSKGTKMPRGDKDQIMQYTVPYPPADVMNSFNKMGKEVLSILSSNRKMNKQLVGLRDYLLPKLMSGEIDVSTLETPN